MAVITPQTDLYLLKVPLEIDNANQLTFADAAAQYNYFSSLPKLDVDDFTYQRKDGVIRFNAQFDDIVTYNYVMYRNDAYSAKWFYAYITDIQYINDSVTTVKIETDTWQTWQFDLTFKPVFVTREHTNDDTVGKNTLPEGLELGELVVNGDTANFGATTIDSTYSGYFVVVDVSMVENEGQGQTLGASFNPLPPVTIPLTPVVNGVPSGVIHLLLGIDGNSSITQLNDLVNVYNYAGVVNAISNIYVLPRSFVKNQYYSGLTISATRSGGTTKSISGLGILYDNYSETNIGTKTIAKPTTLNGYTPKNNKLKCWPYCYFNLSNNAGSSSTYHYEDFSTTNVSFKLEGAFGVSGTIKAVPQSYKNIGSTENAYDYSVTGAKYPVCSWQTDSYTNWLTQNAMNISIDRERAMLSILGSAYQTGDAAYGAGVSGGGSVALGLVGGAKAFVKTGIDQAKNELLAKTEANFVPNQVKGNLTGGDLVWAKMRGDFTYLPMCIKPEYAKCCDDFFSQYGYATNQVKIPNITGRRNWNYVKTNGCYIEGDIPQADMQSIKDMFNRGVTLWHNPATFADYTQTNDIIV